MRRRALIFLLFASTACAGETLSLDYGELVPVTVRVADYVGPVTMLFSASNGAIFELTSVDAPATIERDVPLDSSVSVHFDDPSTQRQAVASAADLRAGDEVVFRPWYWRSGGTSVELAPIEGAGERMVEVDYGCGGYTGRADIPHRFTIHETCANEIFHIGFSLFDGDRRSIATHSARFAETITPPRAEDFDQVAQKLAIELRGLPIDQAAPRFYAIGAIEKQKFPMLTDEATFTAENIAEVELYPFSYDGLYVAAIFERDGDRLYVEDRISPRDPVLDVSVDLPAIRSVALEENGVVWETEPSLGETDFVLMHYGRPRSGPIELEETIRSWMVIKRPSANGAWQLPELPRELEHWHPDPDTRESSSVSYYDLRNETNETTRDVFHRVGSRAASRTAYVMRTP